MSDDHELLESKCDNSVSEFEREQVERLIESIAIQYSMILITIGQFFVMYEMPTKKLISKRHAFKLSTRDSYI